MPVQEIASDRVGPIQFSPEEVLDFPGGIPGFQEHREFVLLRPTALDPLVYLQSLSYPYPRFLCVPVQVVDPEYQLAMEPWDKDLLFPEDATGIKLSRMPHARLELYFVVAISKDSVATMNMLAPIAIRPAIKRGVQAVRADGLYSHAAPLALGPSSVN